MALQMDNNSGSTPPCNLNTDTSTAPVIGTIAPEPVIAHWLQGKPVTLKELHGKVVLIEVFQVNCSGCFVHALPEVLRFHEAFENAGLVVIGLATAFEDFEINTLSNLQQLLTTGIVTGEPLRQLSKAGFLDHDKLPYKLPFRIAMDKLVKHTEPVTAQAIEQFICRQIPDFLQADYSTRQRQTIYQRAETYLQNKRWSPQTFERYRLQGTPSSILIDREGMLQEVCFGQVNHLQAKIEMLLQQ